MSWVKVKQGNVELLIPHQAFKDVYEKNGFTLIEEPKKPTHTSLSETEKPVEKVTGEKPKEVENELPTKQTNRANKNKRKTEVSLA